MEWNRRQLIRFSSLGLPVAWINRSAAASAPTPPAPKHIIIDTDPGVDDAVSILFAFHSPEVVVDALTVVAGNVDAETGSRNARLLAELGGHPEIPVSVGAVRPLRREVITAKIYHGANGIGDLQLPEPKKKLDTRHAADLIIEHVKAHPGQISIAAIGPLTNIAIALTKDPSIAREIACLAFMGGTILSNGNTTPVATFNIYADPEAARIVVNSGIPRIIMVGTDVTTKVQFSAQDVFPLDGNKSGHLAAELTRFRLRRFATAQTSGGTPSTVGFNDLPATMALIQEALFTMQPMKVDIETRGELTSGMTVANRANRVVTFGPEGDHQTIVGSEPVKPNVDVCVEIDHARLKSLFLKRLSA